MCKQRFSLFLSRCFGVIDVSFSKRKAKWCLNEFFISKFWFSAIRMWENRRFSIVFWCVFHQRMKRTRFSRYLERSIYRRFDGRYRWWICTSIEFCFRFVRFVFVQGLRELDIHGSIIKLAIVNRSKMSKRIGFSKFFLSSGTTITMNVFVKIAIFIIVTPKALSLFTT